jgi:transcriptional regulator with GAF, ATPase, and Fis domain
VIPNEAKSSIERALRHLAELEAIARADRPDSAALRAWARTHFRELVAAEKGLALAPPPQAAPVEQDGGPDVLQSLEAVSAADQADSIGIALGALLDLTGGERGFIAIRERDGSLSFPAARAFRTLDLQTPEAEVSRTILDLALRGDAPVVVDDARRDNRFLAQESVKALGLRAVLVVPLAAHGSAFGVLYLDNPTRAAAFDDAAREAALRFARIIAPILARDLEIGSLRRIRDARIGELRERLRLDSLLGESRAMVSVLELIDRVSPRDTTVLITGETGTGKELVARAIHANSKRAGEAFVAVNCGALPSELVESELFGHERGAFTGANAARVGRFEAAHGGTLFLDELGEMPPAAQVKLLRILETGMVERVGSTKPRRCDVRVVAATNRKLEEEVAAGRFRSDLLFRLKVIEIALPPLRARDGDVLLLAHSFVKRYRASQGQKPCVIDPAFDEALSAYAWPGNVRELRNVIERAVVLMEGDRLGVDSLPPEIAGSAPTAAAENLKRAVRTFKRRFVAQALAATGDDYAAAAERLGVHPKYLYQLVRDLEGDEPDAA